MDSHRLSACRSEQPVRSVHWDEQAVSRLQWVNRRFASLI
jgi:hypothetical protein